MTLIVPGDPDQRTGGYLYDARIVDELRRLDWSVGVVGLDGAFPIADELAHRAMKEALSALPDDHCVVIDGLALGGVPDCAQAEAQRLGLVALVHHPLADETGLSPDQQRALLESERSALGACRSVIVTSSFTRRRLKELALVDGQAVHVVEPGVDPAPLARRVDQRRRGETPPGPARLLCVAHLSPRKGQDLLIEALAGLDHLPWTLDLVGSRDRQPDFARALIAQIERLDLGSRIHCHGEVRAKRLNQLYAQADVCLVPSRYEGYGMVVTEALARGLPLISSTGGALQDTVPGSSALRVPPAQADALRGALDRWLTDFDLRERLARAAERQRGELTDWPTSARRFAVALESDSGGSQ